MISKYNLKVNDCILKDYPKVISYKKSSKSIQFFNNVLLNENVGDV
jgi:hypothetical protein